MGIGKVGDLVWKETVGKCGSQRMGLEGPEDFEMEGKLKGGR